MGNISQILKLAKSLNDWELQRISDALLKMLGKNTGVYGAAQHEEKSCRKCGSDQIVKFGKDKNGKPR